MTEIAGDLESEVGPADGMDLCLGGLLPADEGERALLKMGSAPGEGSGKC